MTTHDVGSEFDTVKEDLAKLRSDIASLSNALKGVTSDSVHEQIASIRSRIDGLTTRPGPTAAIRWTTSPIASRRGR